MSALRIMPVSKSNPRLQVEEGTVKPDRAHEYPKGRVLVSHAASEGGSAKRVEVHRFRNGKLTAVNGIPVAGCKDDSSPEAISDWISDADVYYDPDLGEYFTDADFVGDPTSADY
jgi:hypothetical protein